MHIPRFSGTLMSYEGDIRTHTQGDPDTTKLWQDAIDSYKPIVAKNTHPNVRIEIRRGYGTKLQAQVNAPGYVWSHHYQNNDNPQETPQSFLARVVEASKDVKPRP